jgi:hypothetical protein
MFAALMSLSIDIAYASESKRSSKVVPIRVEAVTTSADCFRQGDQSVKLEGKEQQKVP